MIKNDASRCKVLNLLMKKGPLSLFVLMFFLWGFSFAVVLENKKSTVESKSFATAGMAVKVLEIVGPLPYHMDPKTIETYNYFNVSHSFLPVDLWRSNEFSKNEFQKIVQSSVPKNLRMRLNKHLGTALEIAEKYQIDPFWVLAVMWTESHFRDTARSRSWARGLMQIMPKTGRYLAGLLKWNVSRSKARELTRKPESNIEMGVFYLKRLLKQFNHNYHLATIAYNMGPGWVKNRLRRRLPIGNRNTYLNKVKRAYRNISRTFRKTLKSTAPSYGQTYVFRGRKAENFEKKFMIFPYGLPEDIAQTQIGPTKVSYQKKTFIL